MEKFWIFGYGSLMWRPGFAYRRSLPAVVHGVHRSLCVYSHVHRGTPENPGLVLGLDRGGSCHGLAFEIASDQWNDTLSYLRAREQVTMVYLERRKSVRLPSESRHVSAVTYIVDHKHPQYAGRLDDETLLRLVAQGKGVSGHCIDYVQSTVSHLRTMGIHDATLERLSARLPSHDMTSSS